MLGEWSKKPWVKAIIGIVIVLTLVSFFFQRKSDDAQDVADAEFARRVAESVAIIAAEEAAKVLGETGGKVALILPSYGSPEQFRQSTAAVYLDAFKPALAQSAGVEFLGHYAPRPETFAGLNASLLRDAREKYPDVDLFVAMWGLPFFSTDEVGQWKTVSPPKLIVVEQRAENRDQAVQWLQSGLVQRVLLFNGKTEYPKNRPTEARAVFELYYQSLTPTAER